MIETSRSPNWDLNRDRQISREEASRTLDIAFGVCNTSNELLVQVVNIVDWRMIRELKTNAKGMVSRDVYYKSLGTLDIREKQKWFNSVDRDQDGELSFEEFGTSFHHTRPLTAFWIWMWTSVCG